MKVSKEELADLLQFTEYREGISSKLIEIAQENGLVIVYGSSDDLIEFDGAIYDEGYVGEYETVRFDKQGILPTWDTLEKEEEQEVRDYFKRIDSTKISEVVAIWNKDGYSWVYETSIPHATFQMVENEDNYCRGVVFKLEDVF